MSIRIWVFLALLAMGLMSVGGVSVTHAQEFHDCPMPQTYMRLVPETEEYRDSSHQFQECQAPDTEESLTTDTDEHHDDLQLPIYCLMPQTEQYLEPDFGYKELRRHMTQCPDYPTDIIVDPPLPNCAALRAIVEIVRDPDEYHLFRTQCPDYPTDIIVDPPLPNCAEMERKIDEEAADEGERQQYERDCLIKE